MVKILPAFLTKPKILTTLSVIMNQMTLKNMMKNPMNAIYLQILQIFQI